MLPDFLGKSSYFLNSHLSTHNILLTVATGVRNIPTIFRHKYPHETDLFFARNLRELLNGC